MKTPRLRLLFAIATLVSSMPGCVRFHSSIVSEENALVEDTSSAPVEEQNFTPEGTPKPTVVKLEARQPALIHALDKIRTKKLEEAQEELKTIMIDSNDRLELAKNFWDAANSMAFVLLKQGKKDEALAATQEALEHGKLVLPQDNLRLVKTWLLRSWVFTANGKPGNARVALQKARSYKSSPQIQGKLVRSTLAAAEASGILDVCESVHRAPQKLSEAEFLDYIRRYYGCARPTRALICESLWMNSGASNDLPENLLDLHAWIAAGDSSLENRLKSFVSEPKKLADHLPPPARQLKATKGNSTYEEDMRFLIRREVSAEEESTGEFLKNCHDNN